MKLKLFAAALLAAAATVAVPASAAQAAPCTGAYSIAAYDGKVQITGWYECGGPYQPAYLVLWRHQNGSQQFVNSGMGTVVHQCQNTNLNTYSMGGQIVTNQIFQMDAYCG